MNNKEEEIWLQNGLIRDDQFEKMKDIRSGRVFSIHHDLQTLLVLTTLLFTTGIGFLIYKHIGMVGHLLAMAALLILFILGANYIWKQRPAFTSEQSTPPTTYYDHIALLTAFLFISLLTYEELQFGLLGAQWTWLPVISTLIYTYMAYRFDHQGILTLAILSFASIFGLNLDRSLLIDKDLVNTAYEITAILIGMGLVGLAIFSEQNNYKAHFEKLYAHFGIIFTLLGGIIGVFISSPVSLFGLSVVLASGLTIYYSIKKKSTWFAAYGISIAYIYFCTLANHILPNNEIDMIFLFYMLSPALPVFAIIYLHNRIK